LSKVQLLNIIYFLTCMNLRYVRSSEFIIYDCQLKAGHLVISMSYRVGTAHQIKAVCSNHLLMVGIAHPTSCPALS
jgi:hypothetical protein